MNVWRPIVEDFEPGRSDNLQKESQDSFAWGSFLKGPRICVGKSFNLLEYKAIMVYLLWNFSFEDPAAVPLTFERGTISLRPKGGTHVKIQRLDSPEKGEQPDLNELSPEKTD